MATYRFHTYFKEPDSGDAWRLFTVGAGGGRLTRVVAKCAPAVVGNSVTFNLNIKAEAALSGDSGDDVFSSDKVAGITKSTWDTNDFNVDDIGAYGQVWFEASAVGSSPTECGIEGEWEDAPIVVTADGPGRMDFAGAEATVLVEDVVHVVAADAPGRMDWTFNAQTWPYFIVPVRRAVRRGARGSATPGRRTWRDLPSGPVDG
jgi:hypothetical protein